jgi:hypothetical protein
VIGIYCKVTFECDCAECKNTIDFEQMEFPGVTGKTQAIAWARAEGWIVTRDERAYAPGHIPQRKED